MKSLITFFIFFLSSVSSFPQNKGYWDVYHNNRKLLTGRYSFKQNKYILDIKTLSLDSSGTLVVECIGMDASYKGWAFIRTIEITIKDDIIYSKDSTNRLEIDNAYLKQLFDRGKKLDIYTWAYPPPESGIMAKVARIHLCTLRL